MMRLLVTVVVLVVGVLVVVRGDGGGDGLHGCGDAGQG